MHTSLENHQLMYDVIYMDKLNQIDTEGTVNAESQLGCPFPTFGNIHEAHDGKSHFALSRRCEDLIRNNKKSAKE